MMTQKIGLNDASNATHKRIHVQGHRGYGNIFKSNISSAVYETIKTGVANNAICEYLRIYRK